VATRPSPIDLSVPATTRAEVDPVSDEGLIREMIGGSEAALGSLYDRHVNVVFAAALRTSKDRGVAAEVVQETFLALWNQAERFDPVRGSLVSWLLTIARNRAIDRLRAAGRHDRAAAFSSFGHAEQDDRSTAEWLTSSGELIGSAEPEPTPELALTSSEDRASIGAAVAALDPMERAVIVLAYGSGLSQSEIAARLGWPIGTVKTRTRRALRRLRDRLEDSHGSVGAADAMSPRRPSTAMTPCRC
jgi:RNA polymerase sigma-70 factor (ECF subfamily)